MQLRWICFSVLATTCLPQMVAAAPLTIDEAHQLSHETGRPILAVFGPCT